MKKHSRFLTILLSMALVLTMMPALAFAEEAAPVDQYFAETDVLADGEYLITAEADGVLYALQAPEGGDQTKVEVAVPVEKNAAGQIVVSDTSLIWRYAASDSSFANYSDTGMLYFTSSAGLKYQQQGYRPVSRDESGHLYAVSEKAGNPKHYMAFDGTTFGTATEEGAAVIHLYRLSYAVKFVTKDASGHGEAGPGTLFSAYDTEKKADAITVPADPKDKVAPLHTFMGWVDENGDPVPADWDGTVDSDRVITAVWEYTVDDAKRDARADIDKIKDTKLDKYTDFDQKSILTAWGLAISDIDAATTVDGALKAADTFEATVKALPTEKTVKKVGKVKIKFKSAKAGKGKVTVKWAPKKSKFDGYQVKYRVKGKKSWKSVFVKNPKAAKKVIKKLKAGKKYQVKVRGYKLYGINKDVKVFGKMSKVKTTKKVKKAK